MIKLEIIKLEDDDSSAGSASPCFSLSSQNSNNFQIGQENSLPKTNSNAFSKKINHRQDLNYESLKLKQQERRFEFQHFKLYQDEDLIPDQEIRDKLYNKH